MVCLPSYTPRNFTEIPLSSHDEETSVRVTALGACSSASWLGTTQLTRSEDRTRVQSSRGPSGSV